MPKLKHSKNIIEFAKIARQLARSLKGGEVIGLIGDLGAGKTTLVQFLAAELGVKEKVNSPTFVLMKVYQAGGLSDFKQGQSGKSAKVTAGLAGTQAGALLKRERVAMGGRTGGVKTLVHVDAYRLTEASELKNIGLTEYFGQPHTVVLIEWADRVKEILPANALIINLKEGKGEARVVEIKSKDSFKA